MAPPDLLTGLPGEELVRQGLADLQSGELTLAAHLVALAAPRLRRANLLSRLPEAIEIDTELKIYRHLREQGGDAYSRYNSLVREIVSFEQALDHRLEPVRE